MAVLLTILGQVVKANLIILCNLIRLFISLSGPPEDINYLIRLHDVKRFVSSGIFYKVSPPICIFRASVNRIVYNTRLIIFSFIPVRRVPIVIVKVDSVTVRNQFIKGY